MTKTCLLFRVQSVNFNFKIFGGLKSASMRKGAAEEGKKKPFLLVD